MRYDPEKYLPKNFEFNKENNSLIIHPPDDEPYFSLLRLTANEEKLFTESRSRMYPHSQAYEHSWGYVIQANRYKRWLSTWQDPKSQSIIYFGERTSYDSTLVVPTAFASPESVAAAVTQAEAEQNSTKTILKNVDPTTVPDYLPFGFRPYTEEEAWDGESKYDDQTYPQVLIDLPELVAKDGSEYRKLRKNINRAGDKYSIRTYGERDDFLNVIKLLVAKDGVVDLKTAYIFADMYINYEFESILSPDPADIELLSDFMYYAPALAGKYFVSHMMYLTSNIEKFVIEEKGHIVGFTAMSDISDTTTAFCAGIFTDEKPELTPWGMYKTMEIKQQQGFQRANLGGSETAGLYKFKKQLFNPFEELHRTHLVFDPNKEFI